MKPLMQQPSKEVEPNTVLEEIEPGYIYKDKVIKACKGCCESRNRRA